MLTDRPDHCAPAAPEAGGHRRDVQAVLTDHAARLTTGPLGQRRPRPHVLVRARACSSVLAGFAPRPHRARRLAAAPEPLEPHQRHRPARRGQVTDPARHVGRAASPRPRRCCTRPSRPSTPRPARACRLLLRGGRHLSDKQWRRLRALFAAETRPDRSKRSGAGKELLCSGRPDCHDLELHAKKCVSSPVCSFSLRTRRCSSRIRVTIQTMVAAPVPAAYGRSWPRCPWSDGASWFSTTNGRSWGKLIADQVQGKAADWAVRADDPQLDAERLREPLRVVAEPRSEVVRLVLLHVPRVGPHERAELDRPVSD